LPAQVAAATGKPVGEEVLELLFADGRRLHLLMGAVPLFAADERVRGAVATGADVTPLRRVEEERERLLGRLEELARDAQRRAAELESVLDNMVEAVFVVDRDGRVTMSNAAAIHLFGVSRLAEATDAPTEFPRLLELRHPDGRLMKPRETATARALSGETVAHMDQVAHNPRRGLDLHIRVSSAPIRDESGEIAGAVVVAHDVTELTELDRLKDQFLAVAVHELKTPVAVMLGYAQVLLRTTSDSPKVRRMLEAIDRGAHRIDAVVMDLVDISRLQAGHLELVTELLSLPDLVGEVVDRLAPSSATHQVRIERSEPIVVQADRDRLEQVLVNLIDNAIRYSPSGGDIEVTVTDQNGEAVVTVKDQGVGMSRAKQARIFERFYRAHTGTPYDYGGMGVGLHISREIVNRLGGRMWFESEEGKGSSFSFSLPVESEDARSSRGAA